MTYQCSILFSGYSNRWYKSTAPSPIQQVNTNAETVLLDAYTKNVRRKTSLPYKLLYRNCRLPQRHPNKMCTACSNYIPYQST